MKSFALGARSALFFLLLFLSGCSKTTLPSEGTGNGGGSGTSDPVGTVNNSAGFYVRVVTPTNATYDIHKSTDANGAHTTCVAASTELITCYVEVEELDLYEKGISFQVNVPSDMCSWLEESPYYYYHYEPGVGHSMQARHTDKNQLVGLDCDGDGDITTGTLAKAEAIGGVATGTGFVYCDTNNNNTWDPGERTTRDRCIYNYDRYQGPNCCTGTFTVTTSTWDATISPSGGYVTTTSPNLTWAGDAANCLEGPAMATQPKTSSGYPTPVVYEVDGVGLNKQYDVSAPYKGEYPQVYAANYFALAENGNAVPTPMVEPYYRWQCLDHAMEIKAEIRVLVREWNTHTEFTNRQTDWTKHDLLGVETGNFSTYPINDVRDWLDLYGNGTTYDPLVPATTGGTGPAGTGRIYPFPSKLNY